MSNADSSEKEVAMDEVVEERPAAKKTSYLGTIIFLILLALIAGAAWYFQSMWLPQTKQTYQQVRTQVNDFISPKKVDPMAAPGLDSVKQADSDDKSEYAVSAIIDPVEKTEEPMAASAVEDVVPVVPAVPVEEVASASEKSAKESTEGVEEKSAVEEKPTAEEKPAAEMESVAQATFIDDAEATKESTETEPATETEPVTENAKQDSEPAVAADDAMEQSASENKPVMENKKHKVDLAEARQAFWQRNLPKAEALYKQQIENAKANADSWGELGNVYYLQAKWQQAAIAYTEAALLLLNKGDFPQAMYMRYIVVGLDPVQAKRIDDHVKALQAPLKG